MCKEICKNIMKPKKWLQIVFKKKSSQNCLFLCFGSQQPTNFAKKGNLFCWGYG